MANLILDLQKKYSEFNINCKIYYGDREYVVGEQTITETFHPAHADNRGTSAANRAAIEAYQRELLGEKSDDEEKGEDEEGHNLRQRSAPLKALTDRQKQAIESKVSGTVYEVPVKVDIFATEIVTQKITKPENEEKLRNSLKGIKKKVHDEIKKRTRSKDWDNSTIRVIDCTDRISNKELITEQKIIKELQDKFNNVGIVFSSLENTEKANADFNYQPSSLKSKLQPHQQKGLSWLLAKEAGMNFPIGTENNTQIMPPFWNEINSKLQGNYFVNLLNRAKSATRPEPSRGGILADDMGLGKTIQTLALIASDKDPNLADSIKKSYQKDTPISEEKSDSLKLESSVKKKVTPEKNLDKTIDWGSSLDDSGTQSDESDSTQSQRSKKLTKTRKKNDSSSESGTQSDTE